MNKISCLIVDDEALAREGLENYVRQIDFLDLRGICKNALQAQDLMARYEIDLLFLDIEMPKITGIDFLRSYKSAPFIIFTTAYSQYALESFEFDVIDYLMKPITFERFLQAVNKGNRLISFKKHRNVPPPYFFAKVDGKLIKIFVKDILFVESVQNYINIHTQENKFMVLMPLKVIFGYLPEGEFIQVHKSFIVSKSKISEIEGNLIKIGRNKIPISRRLKDATFKSILENRLWDKKK